MLCRVSKPLIIRYTCICWVIPEKIHTPPADGIPENLVGGGSKALEIQVGGGLSPCNPDGRGT